MPQARREVADAARLWFEMRERLVAFVARRIDRPDDAEDIVQEVFLKMGRGIDAVRDNERLEAWIYQITRNAIVDYHRAALRADRTRTRAALDRSMDSGAGDLDALATLAGCLDPMLSRLPGHHREAITLTEYDGLTQAEAARRTGLSVPGMKSRVQRARARLRDMVLACCRVALDARGGIREVRPNGPCSCDT
ncbi:sigma-70 family RNA polymerase sigma factor [Streptosporangium sp. NPDC000396]|uniref:sigma-70 family RNA polymerase sigma factor n=1 Tax=Streptosporangium sp. NPDC000396 TaxID=3366185 RepID=UPI003679EEFF